MPKYNYGALTWKIDLVCGSKKAFCEKVGVSAATLNNYFRGETFMPADFIMKACEVLSIPAGEIGAYFFKPITD